LEILLRRDKKGGELSVNRREEGLNAGRRAQTGERGRIYGGPHKGHHGRGVCESIKRRRKKNSCE